ncbi:hypothetical protein Syun_007291 [Stephania yunnanensis]|uniref:Uncharacterized protein n=1 Tax=Stephania yunnanensis TaxID=152371 RepID=A0AAP0L0U0_9MAGN
MEGGTIDVVNDGGGVQGLSVFVVFRLPILSLTDSVEMTKNNEIDHGWRRMILIKIMGIYWEQIRDRPAMRTLHGLLLPPLPSPEIPHSLPGLLFFLHVPLPSKSPPRTTAAAAAESRHSLLRCPRRKSFPLSPPRVKDDLKETLTDEYPELKSTHHNTFYSGSTLAHISKCIPYHVLLVAMVRSPRSVITYEFSLELALPLLLSYEVSKCELGGYFMNMLNSLCIYLKVMPSSSLFVYVLNLQTLILDTHEAKILELAAVNLLQPQLTIIRGYLTGLVCYSSLDKIGFQDILIT